MSGPSVLPTAPVAVNASHVLPLLVDYANGMTQTEIAAKHGLHIQTVRKRLTQAGVTSRERNRALDDEDLWRARRLIDSGVSIREVARQFGVAHTTLIRALKRQARGARSRLTSAEYLPVMTVPLTTTPLQLRSTGR